MSKRICSIPECGGRHEAHGLCPKHYNRAIRSGQIIPDRTQKSLEEKFWNRLVKTDSCWTWIGTMMTNGYGRLGHTTDGVHKERYAHRISYEINRGPIPEGLVIDHLCRNRGCVNPDHLEAVTKEENVARGEWDPVVKLRKRGLRYKERKRK